MHKWIALLRQHQFPLASAGVALLGTLLTWPISQRFPFALFIGAVMVSAWRGGLRPGLVTTGVSALALLLLFLAFPAARGGDPGEHFLLRLCMFVLIGVLAGYLSMRCKQAVLAHDRFHDSVASLGEALIFTDARGNVTFLNATAQTLTGIAPADGEGKPLGKVFALVHGETRQPLDDPARRALRDNAPSVFPEAALLVAGKTETPIEGKVVPLRAGDDRLVGVAVAFYAAGARRQMEQELRQREEQFRAAFDASPAALLLLDGQGQCLSTNPACQALGEFTLDEGLGQGWTRCIHLDDRDRLLTDWTAALQTPAGMYSAEFRLQGSGDTPRWLRLRSMPFFADMGQLLGHVATLDEVTDLKRAEAARHASEEQAAAAAQHQRKIEEALGQLRGELARKLQAGTEAQRQAAENMRELETAKRQAEEANETLARRMEASETARRAAEETLHGSQLEFARLMDEHLAAKRQAEEALQQARDEFARQLDEHAAARREAEAELGRQHDESDPRLEEHAAARRQAEQDLHDLRQAKAQEIDTLTAEFLNEMTALEAKLAQARKGEDTTRQENETLRQQLADQQARLEAHQHDLVQTRQMADALARENERLQALQAPAAPALIETNGHAEPSLVSTSDPRKPSDWLSFN